MIAALLMLALQHEPEAQVKSFQPHEGCEVNLFASEKDGIANPISSRWDERGRLWVICSWAYPQLKPGEAPDDKVIVLEDADGDGRSDKSTVFARGLLMPMGLELGDGGVYVGTSTQLLHFKDVDGDLRADERRVVLNGFGTGDSHQNINNFRWSPGGELWFCQGLHAYSRVETPWGVERLDGAGVWRFHPKRMRLDPFLHGSMGAHNPWGLDFDDWGQPIMAAGNGHGIYHMVPGMIRAEHFQTFPHVFRTGRKFASMEFVGSSHWPAEWQGTFVTGGFMNNVVNRFAIAEQGASFSVRELAPLLRSTHVSFRPVDCSVGPDGAVYVTDWYNPIIGHYQASFRHPDRDVRHGRIWRVTMKGRPLVKPPPLATLTTARLVEQLASPERWVRRQTQRLLADRPPAEVAEAVRGWKVEDERLKILALGALESVEVVDEPRLKELLAARDARARAYAARVVGRWQDRLADPLALLEKAVEDDHPRVRLEAVVAASYVPSSRAAEVVARAADRPMDAFVSYAFGQAVRVLGPQWQPEFKAGRMTFGGRAGAVLAAAGSPDLLKPLADLARDGKATADVLGLLAATGGPAELELVTAQARDARVLEELASAWRMRRVMPAGDPTAALRARLEDPATQAAAFTLAGLWKVEGLRSDVKARAWLSREAMEALAAYGERETLEAFAAEGSRFQARRWAAAALAGLDLGRAAAIAAGLFGEGDPGDLVVAFLRRSGGAEALGAALKDATIDRDAARLALRAMGATGREDRPLWEIFQKAAGLSSAAVPYSAELVASLLAEARSDGDPTRGEKVFRGAVTNCVACHTIGGAGGKTGPELGEVGTALPADLLVESLLWPNRQVKENYTATLVGLDDGRILQGYRVREDKEALHLRDPATERVDRLPKKRIERSKDVGSLMPEGVTQGLTRAEMRDLVRFLLELGRPGPWQVSHAPFVRHWEIEIPGGWARRPSRVDGSLPLDELPKRSARFAVEGSRFTLKVASPEGLVIAGRPAVREMSFELSEGVHTLDVVASPAYASPILIEVLGAKLLPR